MTNTNVPLDLPEDLPAELRGDPAQPVWEGGIDQLFAAPYWLYGERRRQAAQQWLGCMGQYALQLDQYESVRAAAPLIYHYLHSRDMPLTSNPDEYWPDAALETFRQWINQGCRRDADEPVSGGEVLPPPVLPRMPLRVRKDIRALSPEELADYRMRLDDVMQVWNADPTAPAQVFAAVHGDWCLHYQEAFLLWHRAYLMRFEQTIGCAVPYWNWMARDAAVDNSPDAGLPQAFIDETYVHPLNGEVRRNPLRYAAARLGRSKACAAAPTPQAAPADPACHWVARDPLLYTQGDDRRAERSAKIAMTRIFQEQVVQALAWPTFSQPQGWPGYPWANIVEFRPPQPDGMYPHRTDFDGLYEQPHDNYHGWIGPDMADNNYTAYDPVFWSYHANIDRMFEQWLRAHPAALYSANFPLHPFAGAAAERFEFDDPRPFVYTTIGDVCKNSRALGFDFGPSVSPDFTHVPSHRLLGTAAPAQGLYVLFTGVRCTRDSYTIDVFLNHPDGEAMQASPDNAHYVGRFTRIGMGTDDDKGRCITHGVTRVLDASANAKSLSLGPQGKVAVTLLVTELATGRVLGSADYEQLPGFAPRLEWGGAWPGSAAPAQAAAACCPMKQR